jgi:hypothetical protein
MGFLRKKVSVACDIARGVICATRVCGPSTAASVEA